MFALGSRAVQVIPTEGRNRRGGCGQPFPRGQQVGTKGGIWETERRPGHLAPTRLMAGGCYVLHNLLKNKCQCSRAGFMVLIPATLSPRPSQRQVKVSVSDRASFCHWLTAAPHPPNDQLCVWTPQDNCQLHLLAAHFLPVVKELLRKNQESVTDQLQRDNNNKSWLRGGP